MNKEIFNQLLQHPAQVDPKYKKDLAQLIVSFPYSSNIRILYLSALLNDGDIHFEKELKKSAAYIADRRVLRKLIDRPKNQSIYIETDSSALQIVTENSISETEPSKPVLKKEIKTPPSEDTIEVIEKEEEIIQLPIQEEKKEPVEQKPIEENKTPSLIPELENQIIASAVHASLSIEVDEIKNDPVPEVPVDPKPKPDEKKSFLEWIGAPNQLGDISTQLDPKEQERVEFKKKAEDLINQFIANQPRIDVKKEFFSPGNMAKKSIEDKEEIVTETLASVYAAQGNISKAINTYQQLILKFPEKKSYFATLIEKLKE